MRYMVNKWMGKQGISLRREGSLRLNSMASRLRYSQDQDSVVDLPYAHHVWAYGGGRSKVRGTQHQLGAGGLHLQLRGAHRERFHLRTQPSVGCRTCKQLGGRK